MNLLRRDKKKEEKHLSEIARSLGRRGGVAVLNKYGDEHFREMGKKGGKAREVQDPDYYSKLGKKSAKARELRRRELRNDPLTQMNSLLYQPTYKKPVRKVSNKKRGIKEVKDMIHMESQGFTLSEIGSKYGITRQRVSQIIKANKGY